MKKSKYNRFVFDISLGYNLSTLIPVNTVYRPSLECIHGIKGNKYWILCKVLQCKVYILKKMWYSGLLKCIMLDSIVRYLDSNTFLTTSFYKNSIHHWAIKFSFWRVFDRIKLVKLLLVKDIVLRGDGMNWRALIKGFWQRY